MMEPVAASRPLRVLDAGKRAPVADRVGASGLCEVGLGEGNGRAEIGPIARRVDEVVEGAGLFEEGGDARLVLHVDHRAGRAAAKARDGRLDIGGIAGAEMDACAIRQRGLGNAEADAGGAADDDDALVGEAGDGAHFRVPLS